MMIGGCESHGENGVYKLTADVAKSLQSRNWTIDAIAGGSLARAATDQAAKSGTLIDPLKQALGLTSDEIKKTTKANLIASLDKASQTLEAGDQMLLQIYTHGGPGYEGNAHTVCTTEESPANEPNNQPPNEPNTQVDTNLAINDPEVIAKLDLLKKKGVKLGFLDTSCFGGGSVPQLSRFGCVISTTTAKNMAVGFGVGLTLADQLSDPKRKFSLATVYRNTIINQPLPSIVIPGQVNAAQMTGVPDFAEFPDFPDTRDQAKTTAESSDCQKNDPFLKLKNEIKTVTTLMNKNLPAKQRKAIEDALADEAKAIKLIEEALRARRLAKKEIEDSEIPRSAKFEAIPFGNIHSAECKKSLGSSTSSSTFYGDQIQYSELCGDFQAPRTKEPWDVDKFKSGIYPESCRDDTDAIIAATVAHMGPDYLNKVCRNHAARASFSRITNQLFDIEDIWKEARLKRSVAIHEAMPSPESEPCDSFQF